jgi:hypothetical protein
MKNLKQIPEQAAGIPLFYQNPVLLRFAEHRKMALKSANGFGFSANANAVPLLVSEFAAAVRHYPIVFTDTAHPHIVAVLGLKEGQNLFTAKNGSWRAGTYVPAYLRRYPFITSHSSDDSPQMLAVDAACDRLIRHGGDSEAKPLFDNFGRPTAITEEAMAFCSAFHLDHMRGESLGKELMDRGLLVQRHASMQFPDESRYTLNGFQSVDPEKFYAFSDMTALRDWHQNGWLAAIHLHLASMNNWENLLLLNAENNTTAEQGAV